MGLWQTLKRRIGEELSARVLEQKDLGGFTMYGAPTAGGRIPVAADADSLFRQYREVVYSCINVLGRGVSSAPLRLFRVLPSKSARGRNMMARLIEAQGLDPSRPWRVASAEDTQPVGKRVRRYLHTKEGLQAWMREREEVEEVVGEHPFYDLWQNGNAVMTGAQLRMAVEAHMDLVGGAALQILFDGDGPASLVLLSPGTLEVEQTDEGELRGYVQTLQVGGKREERRFPFDEIVRPYFPAPQNPLRAYSPLHAVGLSVKLYHSFLEYEDALLENGGMPATMFVFPDGISDVEKRRQEQFMRQKYAGPRKAGKVGFASGDVKIERLGDSQEDMQFREGGVITRDRIANAFGVPVSEFTETAIRANAEAGEYRLAKRGILPRLDLIQDALNKTLLPWFGDPTLFCAFDNPVPDDAETDRENAKVIVATRGLVYKNEARSALDLDPMDEFEDELLGTDAPAPNPFASFGQPPAETPESAVAPEEDDAKHLVSARRWFETGKAPCGCVVKEVAGVATPDREFVTVLEGYFAALGKEVGDRLEANENALLFDPDTWNVRLATSCKQFVHFFLMNGVREAQRDLANRQKAAPPVSESFNIQHPGVMAYLETEPLKFAASVNATFDKALRAELAAGIDAGENLYYLKKRISDLVYQYGKTNPERIVRTEEARAVGRGTLEAYRQNIAVGRAEWLVSDDACEYCQTLASQTVPVGEPFSPLGGQVVGEGDRVLVTDYEDVVSPPLHPHCMCALIPVIT